MTDEEAKSMLAELSNHYKNPVRSVSEYCSSLRSWASLMIKAKEDRDAESPGKQFPPEADGFRESVRELELAITKSCLLDRMIYGGEKPSQTPCPVHKGQWMGIHLPTQFTNPATEFVAQIYGIPVGSSFRDAGCRCDMHTTCCLQRRRRSLS